MSPLYALLLATPIFGFQLSAPALDMALPTEVEAAPPQQPAPMVPSVIEPTPVDVASVPPVETPGAAPTASDAASAAAAADEQAYADAIHTRNRIAGIHRILGISTWISMIGTLTLGTIQYSNLYGFGGTHTDNPCVNGTAIGGYEACLGRPWPHAISSLVTSALYFSTFTLSLFMPDPDEAAVGDNDFARTLRAHKILRWVHFIGMISQVALGIVTANLFDRSNPDDFSSAQALATVHMGIGLVTFGALTWAGALMVF